MQRMITATAAGLLTALLSGCVASLTPTQTATRTDQQTTAHIADANIVVVSRNGWIDIAADPALADVQIEAQITASGFTVDEANDRLSRTVISATRDTGRTLTIQAIFPEPRLARDAANITVRMPGASDVDVQTSNGAITVSGFDAPIKANTTNGSVTVIDSRGDANLSTSNGRVQLQRHVGAVEISTTNGSVRLIQHNGPATVSTSNGSINAELARDQPGPLDLRTTNGRITASVGSGFAGRVTLNTSNGRFVIEDDAGILTAQNIGRRTGRLDMVNEGEASRLRTTNGRIEFKTRN